MEVTSSAAIIDGPIIWKNRFIWGRLFLLFPFFALSKKGTARIRYVHSAASKTA